MLFNGQLSLGRPLTHLRCTLAKAFDIVRHQQAADLRALDDELPQIANAARLGVVFADEAAQTYASIEVEVHEPGIKDNPADILEDHIDAIGRGFGDRFRQRSFVFALVIDCCIEAVLFCQLGAFLRPARDTNRAAAFDLGKLPDKRADGASCACYQDRFAFFRLADLQKTEIGGHAHCAEDREIVSDARYECRVNRLGKTTDFAD